MSEEIIRKTKLFVPPPRPLRVTRPRLIERLTEGLYRKLTLISAPAGFGKTTLISEWVSSCDRQSAWLSLDEGDNNLGRFLTYIHLALQTVDPNIGAVGLDELNSQQPPPTETILTALLNDVTTTQNEFILILDDCHVIDAEPVEQAIRFLLENLPSQIHLVMATREDPILPLARLRAADQLTELRANDLRFRTSETAAFLNKVMGLNLLPEDIVVLESRTEGWIAGLQMAALSMQGRDDPAGFIEAFAGSHHYIFDYLAEEVLMHQSERVRGFLQQTSILSRLSGPLCDTVTGEKGGKGMLEVLERRNLFVVPLDDRRQWYRYHHLFTEVLQARLYDKQPDMISILHQRASAWYEQNGLRTEAIRHALAAGDFVNAADLVELAWSGMHKSSILSSIWLGWVRKLPEALMRTRPVLCAGYAWTLLDGGDVETAEIWLQEADRWLDPATAHDQGAAEPFNRMVVVDKEAFRSLPVTIAAARAYLAQALGDVPGSLMYARRVIDLLPEGDHPWRGPATALLGIAYWANGDLEHAHSVLADGLAGLLKSSVFPDAMGLTVVLASIKIAQGRLREAERTYLHTLQIAADRDESRRPEAVDLHIGLSGLYCERGDLEAAVQHLKTAEMLGELAEIPGWQHRLCVAQAGIEQARGNLEDALELLNKAEYLYTRNPLPDLRPVAALKCRIWIAQGRLSEAMNWVREQALWVDDELSYPHEFEHLTLVRLLIACHKDDQAGGAIHDAMKLIERLLEAAEAGGRVASAIEILVQQALAFEALGKRHQALVALERALGLAGPEGYLRIFIGEGPTMAYLLSAAASSGVMPAYTRKLLAAVELEKQVSAAVSSSPTDRASPHLVEPLSERELEVLKLVAEGLSNREISERLFLAIDTVKGHNRRIFGKLQVHRRTEAVARARELGLV